MTPQELLIPRYKVISDYPNGCFKLGEILTEWIGNTYSGDNKYTVISKPDKFPAIFKSLKWWEERNIEELPKYLKIRDAIRVVSHLDISNNSVIVENKGEKRRVRISIYQPATEEEYLQYINSKL